MLGQGTIGQFSIGQADTTPTPGPASVDMWYPKFSEPVRNRLNAHCIALLASGSVYTQANFVPFTWIYPWSYPVYSKRWKGAQFFKPWVMDRFIPVGPGNFPWFSWLSEPVRQKKGLGQRYQQAFTGPPRLLPTPNVTMTMTATEVNADVALFAINVVRSSQAPGAAHANVSITEIPRVQGGAIGIAED